MSCPPTTSLNNQTYGNTCVLAASAGNDVTGILKKCADAAPAPVTTITCYTYVNTTDPRIPLCFALELQGIDPPTTVDQQDITCFFPKSNSNSNSTSPTSPSSSSGPSWPSNSTTAPTSTKPSSAGTASTKTSPASPSGTTASKASTGGSLSLGAMAVAGLALFGLLL
jgi:hypothetical protein